VQRQPLSATPRAVFELAYRRWVMSKSGSVTDCDQRPIAIQRWGGMLENPTIPAPRRMELIAAPRLGPGGDQPGEDAHRDPARRSGCGHPG